MATANAPSVRLLRERLREHFGFRRFRPGQAEAVQAALDGRDTVVVMPTGSGKSLCFQLPALELEGTTVVVSPLIALMKDQADALRDRGIGVVTMNSTLTARQERAAEADIAAGRVEFVYTTPERLARPEFRALLKRQALDLFVVDEAHCISQWGHDFRPEYLALGEAVADLGRPPVLALTATATRDVIADITARLEIPDAELVHTGFYRPNLHLEVTAAAGDTAKRVRLLEILREADGGGIIYVATVGAADELVEFLRGQGVEDVVGYHGRMAVKARTAAQEQFMAGRLRAMVATNAFGLGIDKPDIRFVVHYHLPGTVEAFYQEFGRAGRDGQPARCALLYDPADRKLQKFFKGGRYPDESDLVNAYHTLELLRDRPRPPALSEVEAHSPLTKGRLRSCLAVLLGRGVVRREPGNRYLLLRPGLDRDAVARVGQLFRENEERDELKLQQLVEYAEGHPTCRWRTLLDYFESEELPEGRCGHCDRCRAAVAA